MRRYVVVLTPEPDASGYTVVVPALPGCITEGDTVEEALAMARDAIETYLEGESAADWRAPEGVIVAEVDIDMAEADGVLTAARDAVPARA
ncbi:MAG TPA: type II toxin-antitoxin system HicB family antitoxin [Thermomicrobiales bacterium]|nr:type II toxin-antitoxin system HicB family antitoxin [Thermomicrobiales bacterium]